MDQISTVNHVINYLPAFDLYADATSDYTPFGMLPFGDQDKPVLWVEIYKADTRTPTAPIGSTRQHVKTWITLSLDGSVTGSIDVSQNGSTASNSREWARQITKDMKDDLVKNIFRQQGLTGNGKIELDDPSELLDTYHYKISLAGEKFMKFLVGVFLYLPAVRHSLINVREYQVLAGIRKGSGRYLHQRFCKRKLRY